MGTAAPQCAATVAVNAYRQATNNELYLDDWILRDLLADLMHWAHARNILFFQELEDARGLFQCECEDKDLSLKK